MKKTILTLLVIVTSLMVNAQDTTTSTNNHYRPDVVITDPTKNRDFRQRRVRVAYRTNKFEFSTTYTLRYSVILGISYSFKK